MKEEEEEEGEKLVLVDRRHASCIETKRRGKVFRNKQGMGERAFLRRAS